MQALSACVLFRLPENAFSNGSLSNAEEQL